jgi:electron transfer flavoprotein beta subunit
MNIVVCVKQVPSSNEARMDPVTNTVIRENVASILNPFDAFAVEEAIRLKERYDASVMAISMGVPSAAQTLRGVLALGIDQAMLLTDRAFAGADTLATANALAAGIGVLPCPDLILCGRMATDGDTAQVGPMLAELLDIPHITDVAEIEEIRAGQVTVRKLTDDGYVRLRVPLPALLSVTKEINVPRLPSIAGVLRGAEAEVQICTAAQLGVEAERVGLAGSVTRVVRTMRPDHRVKGEALTGTVAEQASALLQRLREKKLLGEERTE